jgi:hypothetical protein
MGKKSNWAWTVRRAGKQWKQGQQARHRKQARQALSSIVTLQGDAGIDNIKMAIHHLSHSKLRIHHEATRWGKLGRRVIEGRKEIQERCQR